MPLMLVEADVLHRVLRTLEEHVDVEGLRQRQRTPILGLRAMVNDARNSEREYEERVRTSEVIGCLECSVLNDVSHCRECGGDLTIEPVRCVEGDLAPAAERLTREREERRAAEERQRQERHQQQMRRQAESWASVYRDNVPRATQGRRTVPLLCERAATSLSECEVCYRVVRNFVSREQDVAEGFGRRTDSRGIPTDPHATVAESPAESVRPTVRPTVRPRAARYTSVPANTVREFQQMVSAFPDPGPTLTWTFDEPVREEVEDDDVF